MSDVGETKPDRSHIAPVTTHEELIYLLTRASELEHGLACVYLFAGYSLKGDMGEGGMTEPQAEMVRRWKRQLAAVAVEEMLHLAQVSNLLTAIGGAPHFRRPNFPLPASAYPFGIMVSLEPFCQDIAERLVCYEMPEAGILSEAEQAQFAPIVARVAQAVADASGGPGSTPSGISTEPFDVDFKTVGEFYHKIETGFHNIPEADLFIGPPEAQANGRFVDFAGKLVPALNTAAACAGIEMIVEQGEAPSAAHPDAHFSVFNHIRLEFEQATAQAAAAGEVFEPVRPVVSNPMTRFYDDTSRGSIITEPLTHEVADLFNVAYDTMLLMLLRFFAHTDESEAELRHLSRATPRLMATVLRPLGDALATMPAGAEFPGKTAGPGFGFNRDVDLLPHKASAWIFIGERLWQLASTATKLRLQPGAPAELEEAAGALQDLATQFAKARGADHADLEVAAFQRLEAGQAPTIEASLNGPYVVTGVARLVNSKGHRIEARPQMALCRCGGSANKPFCDGTHARIGFESRKMEGRVADHRDSYLAGRITIHDNRGICQHAGYCSDGLPGVFRAHGEPFVDPAGADADAIIAQIRQCPSGALSYAVDGVEFRDRDGAPAIAVSKDGPYRISGGIRLEGGEPLAEGASTEHYALCRCGGSKNKPFCDGTHWYIKFKDPKN